MLTISFLTAWYCWWHQGKKKMQKTYTEEYQVQYERNLMKSRTQGQDSVKNSLQKSQACRILPRKWNHHRPWLQCTCIADYRCDECWCVRPFNWSRLADKIFALFRFSEPFEIRDEVGGVTANGKVDRAKKNADQVHRVQPGNTETIKITEILQIQCWCMGASCQKKAIDQK